MRITNRQLEAIVEFAEGSDVFVTQVKGLERIRVNRLADNEITNIYPEGLKEEN